MAGSSTGGMSVTTSLLTAPLGPELYSTWIRPVPSPSGRKDAFPASAAATLSLISASAPRSALTSFMDRRRALCTLETVPPPVAAAVMRSAAMACSATSEEDLQVPREAPAAALSAPVSPLSSGSVPSPRRRPTPGSFNLRRLAAKAATFLLFCGVGWTVPGVTGVPEAAPDALTTPPEPALSEILVAVLTVDDGVDGSGGPAVRAAASVALLAGSDSPSFLGVLAAPADPVLLSTCRTSLLDSPSCATVRVSDFPSHSSSLGGKPARMMSFLRATLVALPASSINFTSRVFPPSGSSKPAGVPLGPLKRNAQASFPTPPAARLSTPSSLASICAEARAACGNSSAQGVVIST
mmetsp:Transcript_1856/g.5405  ORF Transcript_1856/g.5405 Transcript_1856/m.5405 type:complete len:353 (+) Transcript_1856:368-1426(+)